MQSPDFSDTGTRSEEDETNNILQLILQFDNNRGGIGGDEGCGDGGDNVQDDQETVGYGTARRRRGVS